MFKLLASLIPAFRGDGLGYHENDVCKVGCSRWLGLYIVGILQLTFQASHPGSKVSTARGE